MIKKIFIVVLYYLLVVFLHPTFDMDGDIILSKQFFLISNITSLVVFTLELLLPIIFKYVLKKSLRKSLTYCFILWSLFIILELATYGIIIYHYRKFSTERWNDRKLCYMRYAMVDDLRKNYKLKGKSKEEIYNLLGKVENDRCHYTEQISQNSSYHTLCYEIDKEYIFFCLYFDKNGNVEKTYKWDGKNSYTYDES